MKTFDLNNDDLLNHFFLRECGIILEIKDSRKPELQVFGNYSK